MKISAIKCPDCKDTVFSRARHDFRWCSCKSIAIDGGLDYVKVTFVKDVPEIIKITINETKGELYDDWANGTNKYGLIEVRV